MADTMTGMADIKQQATRRRFVEAAIEVIASGREPTMRDVARQAGVSERTIYRYFPSHDDLQRAVMPEIQKNAHVPMVASVGELEQFVDDFYSVLASNETLVRGLVHGGWAPTFLPRTRSRNLAALQQLIGTSYPDAPEADRLSAAASLRVPLSGAGWVYLRDCGLHNDAAIKHVQWLVRTVRAQLEEVSDA